MAGNGTSPNVASRAMGVGLGALRRLAGSPLLDRAGLRGPAERLVHGTTRNGFRAATVAGRTFSRATSLGRPARPRQSSSTGLFDLRPTDEQAMLAETLREFATAELRPAAQAADDACAAPAELLASAAELGVAGLAVPDELGGPLGEASAVTGVLAAEALGHGDLSLAAAALAPGAVATALSLWGDADQQATYLPAFVSDEVPVAALAIMEAGPLFNPFALSTTATRDGEDWLLSGEKALVLRGADAELLVVAAQAESGPALFVLEAAEASGLEHRPEPAVGLRAAATTRLRLDGVRVPAGALLAEGDPEAYAGCVRRARLAWCGLALGCGRAVLDYVIPYVNERRAFGEPVSHRQAVAFTVSDIAIELEGMRLATLRAAARADRDKPIAHEVGVARRLCAEYGMKIGSDGLQLLGGHGYVKEHPVERWYRDLRAAGVLEGGLLV